MELKWTSKGLSDLARLYDSLSIANKQAETKTVQTLVSAPTSLLKHPYMGEKLEGFKPRDVRRLFVGHYEIRYEIQQSIIYVLRLWHTREER